MNVNSISAISAAAYTPSPAPAATSTNQISAPDGSTVTVVRDAKQNIVSVAATPATFPASAIALASGQATGTAETGIHLTA